MSNRAAALVTGGSNGLGYYMSRGLLRSGAQPCDGFSFRDQAIAVVGTGCSAAIDAERWIAETASATTDDSLIGAQL